MADNDTPQPFTWHDFLALAKELADRNDEASQRTAVSRSYYAVFHCARLVVDRFDPDYARHKTRDSHQAVWDQLKALRYRQAKNAEMRGRNLLHVRKQADYELGGDGDWRRRAQDAVTRAAAALTGLAELLETPPTAR